MFAIGTPSSVKGCLNLNSVELSTNSFINVPEGVTADKSLNLANSVLLVGVFLVDIL
jgi:hypothetical protein